MAVSQGPAKTPPLKLQARERRGAGEERVPAVVHSLLAHIEQPPPQRQLVGMLILAGFIPAEPWRWRLLVWGMACWAISTAISATGSMSISSMAKSLGGWTTPRKLGHNRRGWFSRLNQ